MSGTASSTSTDLRVISLADRPELEEAMITMESSWPAYIRPEPLLVDWAFDAHAAHQLVVVDAQDEVVARAASVPFAWDGDPDHLPDAGWDETLRQCLSDTRAGRELTALCALEIAVVPDRRAQNLSAYTLRALADHARERGFRHLVVPVRPSRKHRRQELPLADYLALRRPDGLPEDPWLRVHMRAGGEVLKVCPASMTVSGSLAQWREWTGLPLDTDGPVELPGALTPLTVSTTHDYAVYVEPNVWVRHHLTGRRP
ncbi:N-acetyltransferase [Streptomyces sp. NPDC056161]|uniref:N-acetyltransferase n=1 Tax=Streptomyces sp. NPDC056161 TaxID=3345732 RepID=UPI0035E253CF